MWLLKTPEGWPPHSPPPRRPHSVALSSEMYLGQLLVQATGNKQGCVWPVCLILYLVITLPSVVTPRLMKCPWPRWGSPLAHNRISDMLVWPWLTYTRLALMGAGKLSEDWRWSSLRLPAATMHPWRGFWDPGVCTAIQLRKHGWYRCQVSTDIIKYLISNFEEKCNCDFYFIPIWRITF